MGSRRPWRVWAQGASGMAWFLEAGMAYATEERAVAAAWREYPTGKTSLGGHVGVGHIDGGAVKALEDYGS